MCYEQLECDQLEKEEKENQLQAIFDEYSEMANESEESAEIDGSLYEHKFQDKDFQTQEMIEEKRHEAIHAIKIYAAVTGSTAKDALLLLAWHLLNEEDLKANAVDVWDEGLLEKLKSKWADEDQKAA